MSASTQTCAVQGPFVLCWNVVGTLSVAPEPLTDVLVVVRDPDERDHIIELGYIDAAGLWWSSHVVGRQIEPLYWSKLPALPSAPQCGEFMGASC